MKIFNQLKDILQDYNLENVAYHSGVATSTLYKWMDGTTKTPHLRTFVTVAKAIGFEVHLVRGQQVLKVAA